MANLTEEQKKAINSYGDQIVTMKNDMEAIKQTFSMYIGGKGNHGYLTLVREIYDNAIDQLIDSTSPCNWISVEFDERNLQCTITDNGKGLPFNDMIRIFTKNHTSKNYTKVAGSGDWSIGVNGVGSKAVNALSETYIAESYMYTGEARRVEFHNGYPTTDKPVKIPNDKKLQGTRISFIPSEILGDIDVKWTHIYKLVRDIFALTASGNKLDFYAIDKSGKEHIENITNTDGIAYFLIKNTKSPIIAPIEMEENTGNERTHTMITWDAAALNDSAFNESIIAFCNYCPIIDPGSTNITGTLKGVTTWFCDYMNKIYLVNSRSKLRVVPNDVKTGISIAIDSDMLNPEFSGQAKEKLANIEMEVFCRDVVMRGLDEWSKTNPNDLQKVAKFIQSIAQVRANADKEKVKISSNYESSAFSGLPSKYVKPTGKDHLELFICEGDSAKSPLVKCRDIKTMGLYPIRGKIISAFSHSAKEVFNNAEIQGILNILFGKKTYTPSNIKELTLEDCKFEKVIFTVDGDVDGFHIASLLLRFFILYLPFLIEAGRVYKAVPPLYMIKVGGKKKFFTENSDMVEYNQAEFMKKYTIMNGKEELKGRKLKEFFIINADYKYDIDTCAANHALSPKILELVLMAHLNKKSGKALEKELRKEYRFLEYKNSKGIDIFEISDDKLYTLYLTEGFLTDCKDAIKAIKNNDTFVYKLNGEDATLYDIMNVYESISPTNLSRFKGLGEMDPDELGVSTILPEERTLIRYTVENVKEEVATIRELESNKRRLLEMATEINRKDLIGL